MIQNAQNKRKLYQLSQDRVIKNNIYSNYITMAALGAK